jgi:hypothetical protein
MAAEVSNNLARQTRSYGGWSWLRDELPLPLLGALLRTGPDFALDSVSSPGAEHALLTGKAALLNFMLDEALAEGLDFRRLVHKSAGIEGISYLLPHLQYLRGQKPSAQNSARAQAQTGRVKAAEALYRAALLEAQAERARVGAKTGAVAWQPDFLGHRLYSTPAGLAAGALGLSTGATVGDSSTEITRGHSLLVFFKAMQPGLLMLSGQDLSGLLPLAWRDIASADKNSGRSGPGGLRELDERAATLGGYPLLRNAGNVMVNAQGLPAAQSLYGPLDEQAYNPDSFLNRLSEMLRLRENQSIGQTVPAGRLAGKGAGLVCLALKKEDGTFIISLSNFARAACTENLNPQSVPGLAPALRQGRARLLYGNLQKMNFTEKNLSFSLPAWEGALVLVEKNRH